MVSILEGFQLEVCLIIIIHCCEQKAKRRGEASYRELKQRIHRSKELLRIARKMKTQKDLMVRGNLQSKSWD